MEECWNSGSDFANIAFVDEKDVQNVPKIVKPKNRKPEILVWADLSITDLDLLDQLTTPEAIQAELAHIFNLEDSAENRKSAILLDLYYYNLQFARDHSFSQQQTSAFFSIVKRTHEACVETPFGNFEQCFQYFRDLLLSHAVLRPPFSTDLFTTIDVKVISEYVINTYFRHFKLYKYIFTPQVSLDLSFRYIGMPPSPVPSIGGDEEEERKEESVEEEAEEEEETKEEESAAASELRRLVRQHLSEEIKNLKTSIEQKIKESEEEIDKKLDIRGGSAKDKNKNKKKQSEVEISKSPESAGSPKNKNKNKKK